MPDPTPTPAPAPAPAPKGNRSNINRDRINSLNNAGQIVAAAQKAEYAPVFAAGGITADKLSALATDIAAAHALAGDAAQMTTSKQGVTGNEANLMKILVELIKEVQQRARQKYAADNPIALKDYAIGDKWHDSRTVLEQTAYNIIKKLSADTLPGVDAAKTAQIQKALDDYKAVQTDQVGGQAQATTARATLEAAVKDVIARRREIQFAADAQWPHTNKANAGIRAEFKLPPSKAMK
jgi:hypothetical protein